MTNRIHNVQMYANKYVVYAKFLEVVQSFVHQYNSLLLSFVSSEAAFYGWQLFCFFKNFSLWSFWPGCLDNV